MKATGIVRRLDRLGRMCIPVELRRTLKIAKNECVEFFTENDTLIIRKYNAVGDLERILEDAERSIRLQEYAEPRRAAALLQKLEEMKAIVNVGGK